ncbi:peptidoglycan D,D-transpeptidase FtsI family protein [Caenispirillum salinarum]|uniref:peptidoglycan D,D-transpeptidase FtsI family protein n=1 Tax=Caenispirillum salinarum TaxID=859058 RepID=UPI00384B0072
MTLNALRRLVKKDAGPFLYPGEEIRPSKRASRVSLHGTQKRHVEMGRTRLVVAAGLFACAFSLVGFRLVDLMLLDGGEPPVTTARRAATAEFEESRADIVDRNGVLLATNLPTVNLYAHPYKIDDPATAARRIVEVLPDLSFDDVHRKLASGGKFVYLDRNLTPREKLEINALGIVGVDFEDAERRVYPQGALASHVVGATDLDNNGIAGLEASLNETLSKGGEPVRVALDVRVQHAVREELAYAMAKFRAVGATGIVLDSHTGELISMVSLPDYDPEHIGTATEDQRFNRATLGVYEMGSTFKLFNTAMALDSGRIGLSDHFDVENPIRVARFTIRDHHPEKGDMSVADILVNSSNIGSVRMVMELGTAAQQRFLDELGLLDPVSLELPENGRPLVPNPWREVNTMTISFGHGIAVTPVHLARATAAMVNGGALTPVTLLKREADEVPPGRAVISPQTSQRMRELMRMVVTDGTAGKADVPGYRVGGKTGTADKVSAAGGYARRAVRTSFAGAFPMDNPRYVLLVVLDEPQSTKETYGFITSGWNAAPTAGRIVARIAPTLGVFPSFAPQGPVVRPERRPMDLIQAAAARGTDAIAD